MTDLAFSFFLNRCTEFEILGIFEGRFAPISGEHKTHKKKKVIFWVNNMLFARMAHVALRISA